METLSAAAPTVVSGVFMLLIAGIIYGIRSLVRIGHKMQLILDQETNHNHGESMKDYMSDISTTLVDNNRLLIENQTLIQQNADRIDRLL